MQQFQVPQFLGREAQLIGPLTIRQTVIAIIAGGVIVLFWNIFAKWLFFLLSPIVVILTLLLLFLKINGRPVISFAGSIFSFFMSPQIYIWEKRHLAKKTRPTKDQQGPIEIFKGSENTATTKGIRELAKRIDRR